MADPDAEPLIAPSQGMHLVFDRSFLPGDSAIMVPHTSDGRVMFAIPWHGHTLVGTTDTPIDERRRSSRVALEQEIEFILETAALYLEKHADARRRPERVRRHPSAGARRGDGGQTAALSRDHTIHIEPSGMLTITGGKWTTTATWRRTASTRPPSSAGLAAAASVTRDLPIHGFHPDAAAFGHLRVYGVGRAVAFSTLAAPRRLDPDAARTPKPKRSGPRATRWRGPSRTCSPAARRALFLNARAAMAMAPRVAELLGARTRP